MKSFCSPTARCLAFLLSFAALSRPAAVSAAQPPPLERRQSLDFDNTPVSTALKVLFMQSGLSYRVDGGPDHEFTRRLLSFCVDDVRMRVVLDAVCDGIGCVWSEDGQEVVFRPVPRPGTTGEVERNPSDIERLLDVEIEMKLGDAAADEVLNALEVLTGAPIAASDEIKASRVNLSLSARPTRAIFDALCQQLGCTWRVEIVDSRARIVLER